MIARPGVENRRGVRMLLIARRLIEGHEVNARWVQRMCGVTDSVARKDLQFVRLYLPVENVQRSAFRAPLERNKPVRLVRPKA